MSVENCPHFKRLCAYARRITCAYKIRYLIRYINTVCVVWHTHKDNTYSIYMKINWILGISFLFFLLRLLLLLYEYLLLAPLTSLPLSLLMVFFFCLLLFSSSVFFSATKNDVLLRHSLSFQISHLQSVWLLCRKYPGLFVCMLLLYINFLFFCKLFLYFALFCRFNSFVVL